MHITTSVRSLILSGLFLLPPVLNADNCFITARPASEVAPVVFTWNNEERLYVYCTQDIINGSGVYPVDTIHCYSTTDMFHWQDEGVCISEREVPWAAQATHKLWAAHVARFGIKILVPEKDSTGKDILAPKDTVIYRLAAAEDSSDGYFRIFSAMSYTPTGPFIAGPPIPGMVRGVIDPFIFVDPTDTSVWMSYRHQDMQSLGFVRMDDSASSITGDINNALVDIGSGAPSGYLEGSCMVKRGDYYFLVYSLAPGSGNEMVAYSTSRNRYGPWAYRGRILPSNPSEYTIHAGICEFKNQWYLFYHNTTFGGSIFGAGRCAGVEYLYFANDSTIDTTRLSKTNRGVGIPRAGSDTIQVDRGVVTGAIIKTFPGTEKTGWYLDSFGSAAKVRYDSVNFATDSGKKIGTVFARIAGKDTSGAGAIEIHLDSATGMLLGTVPIDTAGSLAQWTTTDSIPLITPPPAGIRNIVLVFRASTPHAYYVNWIGFGEIPEDAIRNTGRYAARSHFNYRWINKAQLNLYGLEHASTARIRIFNLAGREMTGMALSQRLDAHTVAVTLSPGRLSSGVYIVSIADRNRNYGMRMQLCP
jgi:arabinoxylan arabinofuranohydrolase